MGRGASGRVSSKVQASMNWTRAAPFAPIIRYASRMAELPRVRAIIQEGIDAGLHRGAQLFVAHRGDVVADFAIGGDQPGVALRSDHLLVWYSSTKGVTAAAVAQQWEREKLDLDAPVAKYIPEFAQQGKEAITIRHVLTHTGGFRDSAAAAGGIRYPGLTWEEMIARVCALPLEPGWEPGKTAGYHALSGAFILGELVQRASGERFPTYVRRHIFEPLGCADAWIGMPDERYDDYRSRGRIATMWDTFREPMAPVLGLRDYVTSCSPGSSGCGPMRDLGRFYQALLNGGELNGQRILEPETVELFTVRHREGLFDQTFQYPMEFGLGFILDAVGRRGRMPYGYGRHVSKRAFGHSGMRSSVAFADPEHDLAVALGFNGLPAEQPHQRRIDAALTELYEELGLVEAGERSALSEHEA